MSWASVSKSNAPDDLRMKTTRHSESRSRAASNGPLRRLAPLASPATFPAWRVKRVTTLLDSLKSARRITRASAFSVDIGLGFYGFTTETQRDGEVGDCGL